MFLNVIDKHRHDILLKILHNKFVPDSYLAGGTGLALQLGHRFSHDFDFFSIEKFNPDDIADCLSGIGTLEVLYSRAGTFHGLLDDVNVTWLYYPNPVLEKFVEFPQITSLKIASILDIGLMKWAAISSRGSMKDFIDMYFICGHGISLRNLIEMLPEKFPEAKLNLYHMVTSLCYFDDAESEIMPKMFIPAEWEDIKNYFISNQKELLSYIV